MLFVFGKISGAGLKSRRQAKKDTPDLRGLGRYKYCSVRDLERSGPRVLGMYAKETSFLNAILRMRLEPRDCLLDTTTFRLYWWLLLPEFWLVLRTGRAGTFLILDPDVNFSRQST